MNFGWSSFKHLTEHVDRSPIANSASHNNAPSGAQLCLRSMSPHIAAAASP
jgi:hypothetical protein